MKGEPMRKPFIAGNWKMHKTIHEAVTLVKDLHVALEEDPRARVAPRSDISLMDEVQVLDCCTVAVCPPFTALAAVRQALSETESSIGLGAQNMHWETQGAFTGEISPVMLQGLCDYVIIGHSERRTLFGETDEMVNRKLHAAFAHGLKPILCVGENLEQNQAGETESFVGGQVRAALEGITAEQARQITVAYEPIWAIGTGKAAEPADVNAIIANAVRATLSALYGDDVAQAMRIQYGGSVKPHNIAAFMAQPEIDGALVGGASLKAQDFAAIVKGGVSA
jgi:triosephosphate isomerase